MSLLITRPFYENPTNYLYHWSEPVIHLAQKNGVVVYDLRGEKANKRELEGRLRKVHPRLVVFNGHGNKNAIFGQDNNPLIEKGVNETLLSGTIVYSRSCQSAKSLGKSSVQKGCRSFIGYKEDFILMFDASKITRPLQDKTAELFLEPSNKIITSLLKGHTASTSHLNGKLTFQKNIQKLLTSESKPDDSAAVRYLIWDMRQQVCLGDPDASIN